MNNTIPVIILIVVGVFVVWRLIVRNRR